MKVFFKASIYFKSRFNFIQVQVQVQVQIQILKQSFGYEDEM